jgi:clan AA aspartic protease (TIGR02281 family)
MTRLATPFVTSGDLIIVNALVTGPSGAFTGRFVLDTGAAITTMTHERADAIGYSARDGFRRTTVRTAIGKEEGFTVCVAELTVLGFTETSFPINVFDLGHDIDGLLGMNFLSDFNYEIRSSEHRILVERDRPANP